MTKDIANNNSSFCRLGHLINFWARNKMCLFVWNTSLLKTLDCTWIRIPIIRILWVKRNLLLSLFAAIWTFCKSHFFCHSEEDCSLEIDNSVWGILLFSIESLSNFEANKKKYTWKVLDDSGYKYAQEKQFRLSNKLLILNPVVDIKPFYIEKFL